MTEQHALWNEPHWTEQFPAGCRVRSEYRGIYGTVVECEPGSHVEVQWEAICSWCPIVAPCVSAAIEDGDYGIRGGLTHEERSVLVKRRLPVSHRVAA